MRSVFAFLSATTREQVAEYLDGAYPGQSYPWTLYVNGDTVLYIDFYDDLARECEPEVIAGIEQALSGDIAVSVVADVSGRHPGQPEANAFIIGILSRFHGVADDELSDHLWTLQELNSEFRYQGRRFFEHQ